eukprot:Amastigsp_a176258_220.p1 type:complete len:153 gc:universal Amastigsp_a176258_220:109-567(+)
MQRLRAPRIQPKAAASPRTHRTPWASHKLLELLQLVKNILEVRVRDVCAAKGLELQSRLRNALGREVGDHSNLHIVQALCLHGLLQGLGDTVAAEAIEALNIDKRRHEHFFEGLLRRVEPPLVLVLVHLVEQDVAHLDNHLARSTVKIRVNR